LSPADLNQSNSQAFFAGIILPLGLQHVQHRPGLLRAPATPDDAWKRPAQSVRLNF
jgi:hypothetical protein